MKFFLFFFLILGLLLSSSYAYAIGFSPTSLIFELSAGEEDCANVYLTSGSETISVSDGWAQNKDIDWKVGLFKRDPSYHGITINYPNELAVGEREVEVCLSGRYNGEYHGVILFAEEQEGSTVSRAGVWLKLTVTGSKEINPNLGKDAFSSENEVISEEILPGDQDSGEGLSSITGGIVVEPGFAGNSMFYLVALGIIVIISLSIYIQRKRMVR